MLFTYSSKGRRELPNARVYVDGPVENLSKDGSFLGRHIYTRLPGVAVQINAFNFPVWGSLEKFAPAFLAGVPTLVKPATPTGYLTEAYVRILVESGLLPDGSLQLVSGSVPDLFEHLRLGDLVGFTGSASTAERLRSHDSVQTGGVRFSSETDSINASVLGPDATPDTPEFDAYVKQLVTEMTVEGGAEVHRHPARDRARGIRRRRHRRRPGPHRRADRGRRPACRGRHDGAARVSGAARRGAAPDRASSRPPAVRSSSVRPPTPT